MNIDTLKIVQKANEIVAMCGTRDPNCIAKQLGIQVLRCKFKAQKGAYKAILRNRFIFLSDTLSPAMETIVLAHELGHDVLHRSEAMKAGGFQEFNLFDMTGLRMEYEANIFAAQLTLEDNEFLDLCERGFDTQQIARALHSDINLVALKADTLISQGFRLRRQEHNNRFLK